MTIDDLVRDTVHGLADEAGSVTDLATGAMVRGRRLRRRRRAGAAVAAVALVGAVAVPYQWVQDQRPLQDRTAAARAQPWWEKPLALPGGWVATSLISKDRITGVTLPTTTNLLVLDRRAGRYVPLERTDQAWPATRGDLVAVTADDGAHAGEVGVRDLADGSTTWFRQEFTHDPQWSSDGRRLLLTTGSGFSIIDTRTGRLTAHPVDERRYRCTGDCLFTWQPDDLHVGLPLDDPTVQPAEGAFDVPARKGVQLFSAATGQATTLLPVRGNPLASAAWSPDGRLVLLGEESAAGEPQVVEVATGQQVRTLPDVSDRSYFVGNDRVLSVQSGSVRLTAVDTGEVLEKVTLPAGVDSRVLTAAPGDR